MDYSIRFGAVFLFDSGSSVGEITGHSKIITSCDFKQTRPYRIATGNIIGSFIRPTDRLYDLF
jgi:hypothetical protein